MTDGKHLVSLSLRDSTQETPEIREWLDDVEKILSEDLEAMADDLLLNGVSCIYVGPKDNLDIKNNIEFDDD